MIDRLTRHLRPDLPQSTRDELDIERLLQLNAHQLIAALAGTINPVLLVLSIWRAEMAAFLLAWCAFGIFISGLQFHSWLRHRGKPRPHRPPRHLVRRVVLRAILGGSYWGLIGVVMTPVITDGELLLLCLVMFGMGWAARWRWPSCRPPRSPSC